MDADIADKEAKAAKRKVERLHRAKKNLLYTISRAVTDFQTATGCVIEDIEIETVAHSAPGQPALPIVVVDVPMKLIRDVNEPTDLFHL